MASPDHRALNLASFLHPEPVSFDVERFSMKAFIDRERLGQPSRSSHQQPLIPSSSKLSHHVETLERLAASYQDRASFSRLMRNHVQKPLPMKAVDQGHARLPEHHLP